MKDALSELKKACRAELARSDRETIARGRSTWFRGRPARAPDGTIALALSDEARVIISEGDVRSVKKEGESYSVEVSAETNFLLRIEKTLKATPDCGCKGSMSKTHDTGTERAPNIDIVVVEVCDLVCGDVVIGGIKVHVCVPVNCKKY